MSAPCEVGINLVLECSIAWSLLPLFVCDSMPVQIRVI